MNLRYFLDQISIQLRFYREAANLSQLEMANKLNVGQRSYQRYESGESVPAIDFLYHASISLGIKMECFIVPEESLHLIGDVTFYDAHQESDFFFQSGIHETELPHIAHEHFSNSNTFEDFESIIRNKLFTHSQRCLALCTPKQTILNLCAQKALGCATGNITTASFLSPASNAGILWGALLKVRPSYFSMKTLIKVPAGNLKCESHNYFINKNHQYAILKKFETKKLGD